MKPTAQQVWEAIIADQAFNAEMPEGSPQREAMRPFIEGSLEALSDQLDTAVSLESLLRAKLKYFQYCIDNNIGNVFADKVGMDASMVNDTFTGMVEVLEPMVADLLMFLEEHELTEEQLMLSPQVGLHKENVQRWRDGTLTIGILLATQPEVLLLNKE